MQDTLLSSPSSSNQTEGVEMKLRYFLPALLQVVVLAAPLALHAGDLPSNIKRIRNRCDKTWKISLRLKVVNIYGFPEDLGPSAEMDINTDDYDAVKINIADKTYMTIDNTTQHKNENCKWWDFNGWDIWINDQGQFDSDLHHW